MESAPTTTDEGDFKKYTPQHPLPEELKKLARDDTICKYCGVSYLIHNEIKALEEKLKEAEKELVILRGQRDREITLQNEKEALYLEKQELLTIKESNTTLISSLNDEVKKLKAEGLSSQETCEKFKNKYMDTLRQLSKLSQVVRQQKDTIGLLKTQLSEWKIEMNTSFVSALEYISQIKVTSKKEKAEIESVLQCTEMEKVVLSQSNKTLNDQLNTKEKELRQKIEELQTCIMSKSELEKNMFDAMNIENELKSSRSSLREMEAQFNESNSQCLTLSAELEQYKIQMKRKNTEISDLTTQQKQRKQEHEVKLQKITLDLQSKEGELATCLRSIKNLENKFKDYQEKETQITQERNSSLSELQELKEALQRTRGDREALKAERELMIQAHQNRIEDLRESFKKKMAEMDNWPQKLQAAVTTEKNRLLGEMKTLEENLKHNFVLELQIEKDKYNELLKKFQAQEKDKESLRDNKLNQIEQKYKKEIDDLKHHLADSKRRATEREKELNQEIADLKKIIIELQDRFAKLDVEDNGKVKMLQNDLSATQQELSSSQDQVKSLEEKLKSSKEKAEFLQGVVERECEERFELTEALSEARKELLSFKIPPGGFNQKRGSISSQQSSDEALLKSRTQMPTNNINLSYNNNNSLNSSRNNSGEKSGRKSKELDIMESRKRIANILGRK